MCLKLNYVKEFFLTLDMHYDCTGDSYAFQ